MKGRILLLLLIVSGYSFSQAILEDERYVPETDSLVLHKLEQWQDLKFGLLMHWGPYSQWSIVESWSICPEDYGWCERKEGPNPNNYYEYVQAYEGLSDMVPSGVCVCARACVCLCVCVHVHVCVCYSSYLNRYASKLTIKY